MLSRRNFLRVTVVTLGAASLEACGDEASTPTNQRVLEPGDAYFPQSVASGDPRPTSVVLWARVVDAERAGWDLDVELEVSLDANFAALLPINGATSVALKAEAAFDNCVKARIVGEPGKTYYYRFIYERDGKFYRSRTGRTKTAPLETTDVNTRFAFVSCQDFIGRYYNSLTALKDESLDFVVHLGDYIYETTGDPSFQTPDATRKVVFGDEAGAISLTTSKGETYFAAKSLDNYRDLYRTYRGDEALRAVHENFAMIVGWDDHEFSDDCWGSNGTYLDGKTSENDVGRRKAANQAWFEYMPVDYPDKPEFRYDPSAMYPDDIRIYRDFTFGKHVHLVLTDLRSYRPDHLIAEDAFPGEVVYDQVALLAALPALPPAEVATPYIDIDTYMGGLYKGVLTQVAMASGYDPARIKGQVSVNYINAVVAQINASMPPPDPMIPAIDPTGLPRGISNFDLNKNSFFGSIGARYLVHRDPFDIYATLKFTADPKTQDLMGATQEKWFLDTMTASTQTWKIWANEFSIMPLTIDLRMVAGVPAGLAKRFYMSIDAWDGFRDKRSAILGKLSPLGNVVAVTGDLHSFLAGTPYVDGDPTKKIVEFVGGAVSSGTWKDLLLAQIKSDPVLSQVPAAPLLASSIDSLVTAKDAMPNPHLAYASSKTHGYAVVEVTAAEIVVTYNEVGSAEVTKDYAATPKDYLAKIIKTRFKTVAGGSDLYKEIDGKFQRWDTATLAWVP